MSASVHSSNDRHVLPELPPPRLEPRFGAWTITLSYALFGLIWITTSDEIVATLIKDPNHITALQLSKGYFYVLLTSCLVFFASRMALRKLATYYQELLARGATIERLEERYQLALDAIGDGVYDWDIVTGQMRVTSEWLKILGYDAKDAEPNINFWKNRIHPADVKMAMDELERHFEAKTSEYECEYRLLTKSGSYIWSLDRGKVIARDPQGKPLRMVGTNRDITRSRETTERMSDMEDRLIHVSRLCTMGELVASIAHEINQPLHAISNYAEASSNVISRGTEIDLKELSLWNQEIRSAVHRTGQVIQRLKTFLSHSVKHLQEVNINEVIEESLKLLNFELRRKRAEVHLKLTLDLPSISADPIMLQQVLVNLIKNALDAMQEMEDLPHIISIRTQQTGQEIEILVADNGPGLEQEMQKTLFEPFATSKEDGMGMGLAICKTIVELHHGRISAANCDASIGQENGDAMCGACFKIHLPVEADEPVLNSLVRQ